MVGSMGNLYGSVENLDDAYLPSADAKAALLSPAGGFDGGKLLQLPEPEEPVSKQFIGAKVTAIVSAKPA
ncbi:hypothetical protein ACP4OV_022078 [Aristida adscensionis]